MPLVLVPVKLMKLDYYLRGRGESIFLFSRGTPINSHDTRRYLDILPVMFWKMKIHSREKLLLDHVFGAFGRFSKYEVYAFLIPSSS